MNYKHLIVIILVLFPVVHMSPVGREGDISETCHKDYCSMFEGICKNGGTCISKGCKGECKCTSEFSGHNCEVPNTPVTTETPKANVEKKKAKPKKKDLGLILSLFRILQSRPEVQNVEKHENKKQERISKLDKNKDGDAVSSTSDKNRKENFPQRLDSEKHVDKDKNKERESDNVKQDPIKHIDSKTTRAPVDVIITPKKHSTIAPSVEHKNTGNVDRPMALSLKQSPTFDKSLQNKNENPIVERTVYPSLSNKRIVEIRTRKPRRQSMPVTSTASFHAERKINPPMIHKKRDQFQPSVFRAPKIKWKFTPESTTGNQFNIKREKDENKIYTSTISQTTASALTPLTKISSVGHKLLSATTLSNLYLSHALLSKSRIFVSTVPNKTIITNSENKKKDKAVVKSKIRRTNSESVEHTTKAYELSSIDGTSEKNKGPKNRFGKVILKKPTQLEIKTEKTTIVPLSSDIPKVTPTQNKFSETTSAPENALGHTSEISNKDSASTQLSPVDNNLTTNGHNKTKKVVFHSPKMN